MLFRSLGIDPHETKAQREPDLLALNVAGHEFAVFEPSRQRIRLELINQAAEHSLIAYGRGATFKSVINIIITAPLCGKTTKTYFTIFSLSDNGLKYIVFSSRPLLAQVAVRHLAPAFAQRFFASDEIAAAADLLAQGCEAKILLFPMLNSRGKHHTIEEKEADNGGDADFQKGLAVLTLHCVTPICK